ncbi:ROK family protein [Peptoanaerobacter stomatis]
MMNIGIDVGGMTIKSGIVDENCNIIETLIIPTEVEKGFEKIAQNMVDMINNIVKKAKLTLNDIDTIGVGIPGVADENGKIHFATNLYWADVDLGKILRENFPSQKIYVENDATVACVAEHSFGSIKGVKNAIMLTLGTGVGGGIIINGEKYSGSNGIGSEIGHMVINNGDNFYECSCGNNGCFETYCSALAIIKYAQKLLEDGAYSEKLKDMKKEDITAKLIFEGYEEKDELCVKVVDRFIDNLSIGIANLINIFAPEFITLGGGVANSYNLYIDELYKKVQEKIIFKKLPFARIVKAQLGNDAGIIGAAMLK